MSEKMAIKMDFRVVDQGSDVKVTKRDVLWQSETRKLGAPDYDMSRVVTVYGTDESVDRHNTKILVDGWDFSDYRKNPTVLWLHNMDEAVPKMPVGSVIGIAREEYARADAPTQTNKRLAFDLEFPKRGTYGWADLCADMWQQKHLRAASVGFRNVEMRELDPKRDKEELEKEGFKAGGWAAVLTKNALMELSLVPVGSNPNALAKALREAVPADLRALFDYAGKEEDIDASWLGPRLEALRVAMEAPEEEEGPADEPIGDEGELGEAGQKLDAPDDWELEIENALTLSDVTPPDDPLLDAITNINDNLLKQLTQLMDEVRGLRAEVKSMRDAAPSGVPATPKAGEPAPSPIDLIIDENLENLERLESIVNPRNKK